MTSFLFAMSSLRTTARPTRRPRACAAWRILTAVLTALGVFAIGLASHSPEAHEHVHDDATHAEHACAITLAAVGFCDTAAQAPEVDPTPRALTLLFSAPESFAWTAPDYWLTPALAPPSRTA